MSKFEVLIEPVNPCGGEQNSRKEFPESPKAYIKAMHVIL